MRTPPLVPDMHWGRAEATTFREEAGFGPTMDNANTGTQALLCAVCIKDGNTAVPTAIVLVNGTSLCTLHA